MSEVSRYWDLIQTEERRIAAVKRETVSCHSNCQAKFDGRSCRCNNAQSYRSLEDRKYRVVASANLRIEGYHRSIGDIRRKEEYAANKKTQESELEALKRRVAELEGAKP